MARDAELDRLKAAQDLAFQRKQDAWQAQDDAWKRRERARDALNRAHEEKQQAYAAQDAAWQAYQGVRSFNGPRIDQLNAQQEAAYQEMRRAFENASAAHDSRNGAAARAYADEGHAAKARAQQYVQERRRLVEEIRSARDRHQATRPAFENAKARFNQARRDYDVAKATHEAAQARFKGAKVEFDKAARAFRARLEVVKSESKRRKDDKRELAEKAGIPYQYRDNVYVSRRPDGTVNLYFGGMGEPNGPGHGHYTLDRSGKVTYKRDPFDPHGGQNFIDAQRDYSEVIASEAARTGEFGLRCRFRGYDAYVESNTNRQGRPKIDIYYGPNGPFGPGHHHAVAYRETPHEFIADELR